MNRTAQKLFTGLSWGSYSQPKNVGELWFGEPGNRRHGMLIRVVFPADSFYLMILIAVYYLSIYSYCNRHQNEDRSPLDNPNRLRDGRNLQARQRPSLQGICTLCTPDNRMTIP
jgi:hypothetical protein